MSVLKNRLCRTNEKKLVKTAANHLKHVARLMRDIRTIKSSKEAKIAKYEGIRMAKIQAEMERMTAVTFNPGKRTPVMQTLKAA